MHYMLRNVTEVDTTRPKSSSHQEEKDTFPFLLSLDPFLASKGQF